MDIFLTPSLETSSNPRQQNVLVYIAQRIVNILKSKRCFAATFFDISQGFNEMIWSTQNQNPTTPFVLESLRMLRNRVNYASHPLPALCLVVFTEFTIKGSELRSRFC